MPATFFSFFLSFSINFLESITNLPKIDFCIIRDKLLIIRV